MAVPVRTTFDANVDLIIIVLTDVLEAMDRHSPEGSKFVLFTSYLPSTYNILNTREGLWIKLKITFILIFKDFVSWVGKLCLNTWFTRQIGK